MSEKQKFQHILKGIREDLTFLEDLRSNLYWKLTIEHLDVDFLYIQKCFKIKEYILDVVLDKVYEVDRKIQKFLTDVSLGTLYKKTSIQKMEKYLRAIVEEKQGIGRGNTYVNLKNFEVSISNYRNSVNVAMDDVRKFMFKTNWVNMEKIAIEDYILPTQRRKYVIARQELEKAKQAIKAGIYEDVFKHLRPAIDLSIKERFGFSKIWMKRFLDDAKKYNFPLPSYATIYYYYNEGSGRLHSGKIHTPLECQKALDYVDTFIDNLELSNISQEQIEAFKQKSDYVE